MATAQISPFVFSKTIEVPSEFRDFINRLVGHVKLNNKTTPPVMDEHYALYLQAFISPSLKPLVGNVLNTNKKLEFIGDAALQLSATEWLDRNYPDDDVARLTFRRQCMIGNKTGLMDLAGIWGLEAFLINQIDCGGKKLLPNVVEAIIGVMYKLHGFEYVDAFLSSKFDQYAEKWFQMYLPEGIKIAIMKSNTNENGSYGQNNYDKTTSYRNELDEFIFHFNKAYPQAYFGEIKTYFEQIGEASDVSWIARVHISVGHDKTHKTWAQSITKKEAQNEACYKLLGEIRNIQYPVNYNPKRKNDDDSEQIIATKSSKTTQEPVLDFAIVSGMLPTTNYKGMLITLCQRSGGILTSPKFVTERKGLDHAPEYISQVTTGTIIGEGVGSRKNDAEQNAAKNVISIICKVSLP